ncbi:hypothetical protein PPACK8108_LOCUS20620 [Phakopsora pachyrhizi]|uniref:Centrosomin N-terminal motif 1 domain-containing protein n=1 Tax=Phakopsora pachyrhizi TaxID=170000 RepID=A0AAV0BFG3_PHAPC|nr:hypothetical protein PPACK8108_LOCUS20620 [Phakopsora pachyrhizi]
MDSEEYSVGGVITAGGNPDKTAGGVSRLAGLTFGTDEDSFHSDEFDKELGKALATGVTRKQQLKQVRESSSNKLNSDSNQIEDLTPDQSVETSQSQEDTDGIVGELASFIKSKPGKNSIPKTGAVGSSRATTSSGIVQRLMQNSKPQSQPSSKKNLRQLSNINERLNENSSRPRFVKSLVQDQAEVEDSNMSMLQTLNDSAAFALSPPASPEASRGGSASGSGMAQGNNKRTVSTKLTAGNEPIRSKGNHLTLREQEKVIDEVKKENFNLKLKIYFLEDRLAKLAPDQVDLALKENVEIKVEFQTVRQELKRYKRLLLEAERAIEVAKADRDELLQKHQISANNENKSGRGLEAELRRLREELDSKNKVNKDLEDDLRRAREKLLKIASKENITTISAANLRESNQNQRATLRDAQSDDWAKEEHLLEIKNLRNELTEERQLKEDLLGDNHDLRSRLIETKNALQDSQEEINRINRLEEMGYRTNQNSRAQSRIDDYEDHQSRRSYMTPASTVSSNKIKDLRKELEETHKQIDELEGENSSLRSQINSQIKILSSRNSEKEDLQDQVHNLKRKIMELEDELERGDRELENVQRGAQNQTNNDQLQDELNVYRDKLASALLTLEKREKEIDELNAELQEREIIYADQIDKVDQEIAEELEATRVQREELQELLVERENQVAELSEQLREVINLQEETEKELREVTRRLQEKEEDYLAVSKELEDTQADLKEIGAGNRELAAEVNEKEQQINNLSADLDELDQELANQAAVHEQVVIKLRAKLASSKSELAELSAQHESCLSEVKFLREKQEELVRRYSDIEEKRRNEADSKRRLEREMDDLERELRVVREEMDLQVISSKKEKRELQTSFQQTLEVKQKALAQAESDLTNLKARLQLERIQKTKKELNEKFEEQTKAFRETQNELVNSKNRLQLLEDELSQEHSQLSKTENQYREQLNQRNTLLLTIYQFIEKLVNSGNGNKKSSSTSASVKPFSNFSAFQESIVSKLKSLGSVQSGFDIKIKEVERRLEKQYASLKRQHDSRMRQLDGFESEVDAARETCGELQKQIESLRQRASIAGSSPGSITEQRQANNKVSQLEKRLHATQIQLKTTEEKFKEAKIKVSTVEASWQARLKELQERNRELEEKVKRERQGAKERKNELDSQVSQLREQIEASDKRGKQLELILKKNQESVKSNSA